MTIARPFRLLPVVMIAGTVLLALKGVGLVREAQAQTAPAQPTTLASADDGIAAPKDFADSDSETGSAAQIDVLTSLAKRRTELDTRAREQDMRENVLAATEKRVDDKIASLKQLQTQITALLGQRDAAQDKQVASLVKTYSAMKPKDAARIFDGLDEDVLIAVAQAMKSDALAPILAGMNPSAAQKLTVRLASRLNVPDVAAPPPAAVPAPTAAAAGSPPAGIPAAAPQAAAPQASAPQAAAPSGAHG